MIAQYLLTRRIWEYFTCGQRTFDGGGWIESKSMVRCGSDVLIRLMKINWQSSFYLSTSKMTTECSGNNVACQPRAVTFWSIKNNSPDRIWLTHKTCSLYHDWVMTVQEMKNSLSLTTYLISMSKMLYYIRGLIILCLNRFYQISMDLIWQVTSAKH